MTRPSARGLRNIALVAGFLFVVDGCLYRDPWVTLPHGYSIVAISPRSPCELQYTGWHDDRKYSDWSAMQGSRDGGVSREYSLMNSGGEFIDYETEAEWRAAIIEKNADPRFIAARLSGVLRHKADKNFAIGTFDGGYWLLDLANHQLSTWKSKEEWMQAVTTQTSLKATWLHNPKGRLNQSRELGVLVFYGVVLAVALVINFRWK